MTALLPVIGFHIGRVLLASLFLLGSLNKIISYSVVAERMDAVGLVPAGVLLPATISLELIGGTVVALGLRYAWVAALVLCAFTLATNVYFHRFWELSGEVRALELSLFFKNVAIAGGLLLTASVLNAKHLYTQKL